MKKLIPVVIASTFAISACQAENPFKTHTVKESATFLMQASANAEKRLGFDIKKDDHGYGWLECMEGKNNPEIDCKKLYTEMIAFAREGHIAGFKKITLDFLTDKTLLETLGDDYAEIMISTHPVFYGSK